MSYYTDTEADTELDLGTVIAGLSRHIDDFGTMLAESTIRPRQIRLSANGVADAAGNALIVFDTCPQGSEWGLFQFVVGGVTWETAAVGSAIVFIASSPPTNPDLGIPLFNVLDEAPSMPNVSFYLEHQIFCRPAEALCVKIVGGTATQQYAARANFFGRTMR